jgi:hypothetical protein
MLPAMCKDSDLDQNALTYTDLSWVIHEWLISAR